MPGPLQHSPTPWHWEQGHEALLGGEEEAVVISLAAGYDPEIKWKLTTAECPNKADEVLILHAPDLYHTLREFLDRSIDVVAEGRSEPLARYVAAQNAAVTLLNTIMKEAQTNG